MILKLDENLKQEIEQLTNDAFGVFDLEYPEPGIEILVEAFKKIPDPKTEYPESFNLLKYICVGYFRAGEFDKSEAWLSLFLQSDSTIRGYGESEYLAGKIAFEKSNLADAKKWLISAHQKSGGRVWQGDEDKRYSAFFKANCTDLVGPETFKEMLSTSITEIADRRFSYALSLLYDCLNLHSDNAVVYFNKGVCHYELDELDFASNAFTSAYMLEGLDVFIGQDAKYFNFLKTKIEIS